MGYTVPGVALVLQWMATRARQDLHIVWSSEQNTNSSGELECWAEAQDRGSLLQNVHRVYVQVGENIDTTPGGTYQPQKHKGSVVVQTTWALHLQHGVSQQCRVRMSRPERLEKVGAEISLWEIRKAIIDDFSTDLDISIYQEQREIKNLPWSIETKSSRAHLIPSPQAQNYLHG